VYGKSVPTSGPLPAGATRRGKDVVVRFTHADGGLVAKGGALTSFELADKDGFHPATAKIEGDTVVVSSPDVQEPAAVRYAWSNYPEARLFNGAGLPATPFRAEVGK
jgi:sialate O-acetylesterase